MSQNNPTDRVHHVFSEALEAVRLTSLVHESVWEAIQALFENATGKVVFTGVGKSGYIAMKLAATFTSLGRPAFFIHPVEALHGDSGAVRSDDILIAFSFSGNTKELLVFLRHVRKHTEVKLIGVTGGVDSKLASLSHVVVPISIRSEGCPLNLAPMASTTAMLVAGDAIAALVTSPESFGKGDFALLHPSGTLGLSLTPVAHKTTMSPEVLVVTRTPFQDVLRRMTEVGKGIVGVVSEEGDLVGSITDGDIRRFFLTNTSCESATAESVMNGSPKSVLHDDTLRNALTLMETHKITNLFVLDERNQPLGIIHIHDILEA